MTYLTNTLEWLRTFPRERWLVRWFVIVHVAMAIFVVYAAYDQDQAEVRREKNAELATELTQEIRDQAHSAICYTAESREFYLLVLDVWSTEPSVQHDPDLLLRIDAERQALRKSLAKTAQALEDCDR